LKLIANLRYITVTSIITGLFFPVVFFIVQVPQGIIFLLHPRIFLFLLHSMAIHS
jgi:hypothetical protein